MFLLVEQRQLHVLAGGGGELAARRRVRVPLLLVAAHAEQEEEAGDHQREGDTGDQDVQDLLLQVVWGLCGERERGGVGWVESLGGGMC